VSATLAEPEVARSGPHLRVGLIAPPWLPVPPPEYGGTETVVDLLARGLASRGCQVTLFATGDSTCPVRQCSVWDRPGPVINEPHVELRHVQAAYDALADVDIVHDHTLLGPWWAATEGLRGTGRPGPPVVSTLHGPLSDEIRRLSASLVGAVSLVAISRSQRDAAPEVPVSAVIHHGVELDRFPVGTGDGDYVLFLGRMCPDKGAHRAIVAARGAGRRIMLAAKMREDAERTYFRECVEPLLGPDAIYLGEVGGARKLELIAAAEALINPIRWAEPFGLVMIESLACGTPVLSFGEGAAPEIVRDGRTGFLCADESEMVVRLRELHHLDRSACRADVAERFSAERMVADHLDLYRRLTRRPAGAPDLVAGEVA
jgi:glycosyltransferase involved in cell wall biosynthesis